MTIKPKTGESWVNVLLKKFDANSTYTLKWETISDIMKMRKLISWWVYQYGLARIIIILLKLVADDYAHIITYDGYNFT